MAIFLLVALVVDGLMVWGFISSRKNRGIDWRHLSAFVGFSAAVIAVTGTTLNAVVASGHTPPYNMSPVRQVFGFLTGIIIFTSIVVTFVAGLLSRGTQRIALIGCTVVVSLMVLGTIAAHFGD